MVLNVVCHKHLYLSYDWFQNKIHLAHWQVFEHKLYFRQEIPC